MQDQKSIGIIRILAVITVAIALYLLQAPIKTIWLELTYSYQADMNTGIFGWDLMWMMWVALLLILMLIAAYGLFRLRTWAWMFALCVFSADLVTRLFGIFNLWLNRQPGPPSVINDHQGQIVIESISLLPMYLMVALSLISIIILLQKPIKNLFSDV
ncbi:MAG: hypothetical protein OQK49_00545 [Proteobacteria bacterium]|nr:hypothetical protein [Pseudomonadota bacterium]